MPIVQIIIFGFALTNEVKNESIAILDQSKDATAAQLISKISASRYFNVSAILHNPGEIAKTFQTNKAKLILILPSTFGSDLRHLNKAQVQLIADASDPNTATTLVNYATAIITDYQQ